MATALSDIDEIRRHMAQIRRELHEDVKGVVEGAEAATDWRRYVRNYPWATTGLALAVGFLIIPRRHRPTTIQIAQQPAVEAVKGLAKGESPRAVKVEKERKSLLMMGLGMIAPVALRAAQGYALKFAEQWLAQKMADSPMGNLQNLAASFAAGQGGPFGQAQPQPQPSQSPPYGQPQRGPGAMPGGPRY